MRVPGEGTERLIDRAQEAQVYRAIAGRGLCDDPVYLDPDTGFKITAFLVSAYFQMALSQLWNERFYVRYRRFFHPESLAETAFG